MGAVWWELILEIVVLGGGEGWSGGVAREGRSTQILGAVWWGLILETVVLRVGWTGGVARGGLIPGGGRLQGG